MLAMIALLVGCARVPVAAGTPQDRATHRAPPQPAPKEAAKRYFEQGMAALRAGEHAIAIAHFKSAWLTAPHPNVAFNIGMACAELGLQSEAIHWLRIYVASNPEDRLEVVKVIGLLEARLSRRCTRAC
ncbi:MAG: hypothetical protein HYV09_35980 [Deltaproteobacteria bacterium]|nr:hypothetical protein [Deltaproteobacteria bacterium]